MLGIIKKAKAGYEQGRFNTSPYFSKRYNAGDLAAGRIDYIDLSKNPYGKYLPFNEITVTNLTNQKLEVYLDDFNKLIPPNSIINLTDHKFRNIQIKNIDAVDNDEIIEIVFKKSINIKEILDNILGD